MKINKTTSFLLYAADLEPDLLLKHGMINAFLDDTKYEKTNNSLNEIDIFILLKPNLFNEDFENLCCALRDHCNFLDEYDIDNSVVFRFKLSDKWKHIKNQLKSSKYSKIDKKYVEEYFSKKTIQSHDRFFNPIYKKSMNYMILTKDSELKEQWEEKLNITIPDEVELWEKLHLKDEVLRYEEV
jgi:hypothetical protein